MRTDFGGGAYFLGHRKRALKQLRKRGAQGACRFSSAHRILDLAQNLRLAQHHGVQPAGHAKGVACDIIAFEVVGVGAQFVGGDAAALGQPGQRLFHRGLVAGAVNFGAVAGGNDGRFRVAVQRLAQGLQVRFDLVHGERKSAPHV